MWGLEGRVGFCLDVFLFFELEREGEGDLGKKFRKLGGYDYLRFENFFWNFETLALPFAFAFLCFVQFFCFFAFGSKTV